MPGRQGYEAISDSREGGRLRGWRGAVAFTGVVICLVGQVLSWTQTGEWCHLFGQNTEECDGLQRSITKAGTYLLFLLLLAGLNLYSYLSDRADLRWCSAVLMFEVFDVVIRDAAAADHAEGGSSALLAAYILSVLGAALTFVIYPLHRDTFQKIGDDFKAKGYMRIVFALVIFAAVTVGSILIWANGDHIERYTSTDRVRVSAAFVGLWYFMSVVTDSVPGQELAFIYMAISIERFEPFTKRDDGVNVGYAMVFAAYLATCFYHLVVDCLGTKPKEWCPGEKSVTRLGVQIVCVVLAAVGAVLVWSGKETGSFERHHPGAHECWVVLTMLLVSLIMLFCELSKHAAVAVFAMCLMISVIGEACENINSTRGNTAIRIGYILLFVGSGASFISLPVSWNTSFSRSDADNLMEAAETKSYVQSALAIFCSVLYLWSESVYEGRLGFFALIVMVAISHGFVEALQWVYVVALLTLPRLTPFTATYANGGDAVDTKKCALLVCFFSLLNIIYYHYQRFSFAAFTDVRLFTLRGGGDGDAAGDDEEAPQESAE